MNFSLYKGDCLEVFKKIPSGSVDAIITDPPYGTIKGLTNNGWDADKTEWDLPIDHKKMMCECFRVLRNNGRLLLFSQDPYTGELMTKALPGLPFLYRLTWLKDHFGNQLSANKCPVNFTEDICFFSKESPKHDYKSEHPLRDYAEKVFSYIGKKKKEVFNDLGNQGTCHFMRFRSSQFMLCTAASYSELVEKYKLNNMPGFIPFAELEEVNQAFRQELNRKMNNQAPAIFNLKSWEAHKSNILEYKKPTARYHPTQKPVPLLEDLIETYSAPGNSILDFTMGSGSTGIACANTGRDFIGIEKRADYFDIAKKRITAAVNAPKQEKFNF